MNTSQKLRTNKIVLGIVVVLCGFVLFQFFGNSTRGLLETRSMFRWWVSDWFNFEGETTHGPLIFILSGWILWRNLKNATPRVTPSMLLLGSVLIFGGLTLHFVGYLVQQTRLSIFGFLFFLNGAAYILGGKRWGRAMTFPCLLMVFSVHWNVISHEIGFVLRLWVVKVSYFLTGTMGIDVLRSGTQLFSADGSYQYDVAAACSGIRSLVALSSLSLVLGYLNFHGFWRRLLILVLALPYAFVGNVLRILAIILAAEWFGQKAGTVVHEWFGFLIFLIVLGLCLLTVSFLQKYLPEKQKAEPALGKIKQSASGIFSMEGAGPKSTALLATAMVLFSAGFIILTKKVDAQVVENQCGILLSENLQDPVSLPEFLSDDWYGRDVDVTAVERRILPADTGFSRKIYFNLLHSKKQVFYSIVLSGRNRGSIHRPELCLVGQGWTIINKQVREFEVPELNGGQLLATLLHIEKLPVYNKGEGAAIATPGLFAYWFVGGDKIVPSHWERMLIMAKDRLFGFKTHRWAYVFAQTTTEDGEEAGLARLQEVIALTVPRFQIVGFEENTADSDD